jgi:hypothetical protein
VIVQNDTILQALDKNWNDVAPKFFFYERNDTMSKLVRKKYFGKSKKIGKPENLNKFTIMLSDRSFFWPTSEAAKLQSKVSPVYLYFYSHTTDFSLAHFVTLFRRRFHYIVEILLDLASAWVDKHIFGRRHHNYGLLLYALKCNIIQLSKLFINFIGCCHADEQFVQFNTPFSAEIFPKDGENYLMSKDFVKLWADFARAS